MVQEVTAQLLAATWLAGRHDAVQAQVASWRLMIAAGNVDKSVGEKVALLRALGRCAVLCKVGGARSYPPPFLRSSCSRM